MSRRVGWLAGLAVLAVLLAGCTGGEQDAGPTASPTTTEPTSVQESLTPQELAAELLGQEPPEPFATVEGTVLAFGGPASATLEVHGVQATESSTTLLVRLVGPDDSMPSVRLGAFNAATPLSRDIRDVAVTVGDQRLRTTASRRDDTLEWPCACSRHPWSLLADGQPLTALLAPLPGGTATVTVEVPGFPAVEDVPVTWS